MDAGQLGQAFNRQSLGRRAAIVSAGPVANLLLAVLLYASVNWMGMQEPMAYLARPVQGSIAESAGLQGGVGFFRPLEHDGSRSSRGFG